MIISYLIGAIPTAYIYGKLSKRIDIRRHGSGNVGATNVFRVLGKGAGATVLICDILKGVLAVAVVPDFLRVTEVIHRVILALVVVSGHNWTVFLNFKGGKGIATSLGALIGLTIKIAVIRPVLLGTVCVWLVCFLSTGYVSLSSIVASVLLPLMMAGTNQPIEIICLGVIFCLFVVLRHRPNIKRLLSGQEPRVSLFRKKK
ncbi:MAG: acyl-phosphate glycerol 3-phosphate acyltransferase [Omnitrophica WOR_2 bacterium RIFCSPLOWO2_12_FULL_50_9]|nr:MAG: acyl-phosphate glycerol 3-phosphate acyltransferase [Omnitrophica WOR_2 bacterium RIFCSPHIGHO2_02_FULL_50_17]OGX41826.1 MAG: acyl-phosphate glycerol 3-phosphate acyltransferase [Omnitrophica WOR_2 bacterium RIFCSPLOWO2_12_FULL_50_9]